MNIRQAGAGDAETLSGLINAMVRDTLITFTIEERSRDTVARQIADHGHRFLVAEADGEILGYATYKPFRAGPGYRHTKEHSILLASSAHGRGLGRLLMARLEQVAIEDDVHVLVAGISGANPGAVAFHAALGFEEIGRMPQVGRKQGQWLDLVLMQKFLAPAAKTPT